MVAEVGKRLKPQVYYHEQLRSLGPGKGVPDGGFFLKHQLSLQRPLFDDTNPTGADRGLGVIPERGVVEIKSPKESIATLIKSPQVAMYLESYGLVLCTNLYQFRVMRRNRKDPLEEYNLAESEAEFWALTENHERSAAKKWPELEEFLFRAMLSAAPLKEPAYVAQMLASHARSALRHLDDKKSMVDLEKMKMIFEKGADIGFEGEDGDRKFKSLLVQTLVYGVFSAWANWHHEDPQRSDDFDWKASAHYLRVPAFEAFFNLLSSKTPLQKTGLSPHLQRVNDVLTRVDRLAFFHELDEGDAVHFFYEPFLEAYDPKLREDMGVWYTPKEVVRFMVRQVDHALKQELGLKEGLANPRVRILDPCCGTGAFLLEAIDLMAKHFRAIDPTTVGEELKKAVLRNLRGFEILPASYVIAHMQIAARLNKHGATLNEDERPMVILTNALTHNDVQYIAQAELAGFPEMERNSQDATRVKQEEEINVVIGNPPYDGMAGIAQHPEERALSLHFRVPGETAGGQGNNDPVVRFFAFADKRIRLRTKYGIVCLISSFEWLTGHSYRAMRSCFLQRYDRIWVDNLHGDSRETGKLTPEGLPDPSVFSTEMNRDGIRKGTAITTLVIKGEAKPPLCETEILYRDFRGADKRDQIDAAATLPTERQAQVIQPLAILYHQFRPRIMREGYAQWPSLQEVFKQSFPGIQTSRDDLVIDAEEQRLRERIAGYFDLSINEGAFDYPLVTSERTERPRFGTGISAFKKTKRFDPIATREYLAKRGMNKGEFRKHLYRPWDVRWLYWEPETKLLDEKREESIPHFDGKNVAFFASEGYRKGFDCLPVSRYLGARHIIESGANGFPCRLAALTAQPEQEALLDIPSGPITVPNLTSAAMNWLSRIDASDPDDLFYFTVATLHSPEYRRLHGDSLAKNWPRLPLPAWSSEDSEAASLLARGAALGRKVVELLDPELPAPIGFERFVKHCRADDPSPDAQITKEHLIVSARWGRRDPTGATMPGPGWVEDPHGSRVLKQKRTLFDQEPPPESLATEPGHLKVFLNEHVVFRDVPRDVWEFQMGGYQVLKKWLSYREYAVLGRPITVDEMRSFGYIARKIAALLALRPELDRLYNDVTYSHPALEMPEWLKT